MVYRPFHLCNALDIPKLSLGADSIVTITPSKTAKDVARFLLTAYFDQPTWRLGKEPDRSEQEKQEDDLERNGKTPAECGFAAIDKGQSTEPIRKSPAKGTNTYNSSQ